MIDLFKEAAGTLVSSLGTPKGIGIAVLSFFGLSLVITGTFVRSMIRLRTLALASNFCLGASALLASNVVSVLLFVVLILLNAYRLQEIRRLTVKVQKAASDRDLSGIWLRPYMKQHRIAAGTTLFSKGDPAGEIYLLVEGEVELVEIAKIQPVGEIFGEISFFSPQQKRTLTVRCNTNCVLLSMDEPSLKQLYFQNPRFAFEVTRLIATRLSADVMRLSTPAPARAQAAEGEEAFVAGTHR
ncbi:hypothetical protein GCM10027034_19790 [Ramlibacter solisilvae]|uniref:Crp/Fnr family transcriptional regulator n=1 Tax=Ramlibacter tataouinensis TaxID=94132 RepID=UPI000776C5C4|nr:cyclic nucleotide-binding domain-containing protein [Ramlibacter tataouinensis]